MMRTRWLGLLVVAALGCAGSAGASVRARGTATPTRTVTTEARSAAGVETAQETVQETAQETVQEGPVEAPAETVPATGEVALPDNPYTAAQGAPAGARRFRGWDEDELLREMATRPVRAVLARYSSSTINYQLDLGDGLHIAFKPARRGEANWWRHEILGYRFARALGITNRVPPAVSRTVPIEALAGHTDGADLVVRNGRVAGAAIYWMPTLARLDLHTPENRPIWNAWLDPARPIPAAHRTRALQLATLIAFDYLQANFDRWNGANLRADEHGDLVFRDNNRAWYPENLVRIDRGGIDGICRVPAWLVPRVQAVTGAALRIEAARDTDPEGTLRRLRPAQVRAFDARRTALLQRLNACVARHGRDAVLVE